jgi:hypothetical protein
MYEVCVRIGDVILVLETVDSIESASYHVSWHRQQGQNAYYRPKLTKVA